jgi:hypothetical protein
VPSPAWRYFADENALGLAKLLIRAGRSDLVHPGHQSVPEVPLGTRDLDWMPVAAGLGLIVLTRDRRIRTRPTELATYRARGLRSVWIGGRHDLRPARQVETFLEHERRLHRGALKRGPGLWAVALTPSGVRPLQTSP